MSGRALIALASVAIATAVSAAPPPTVDSIVADYIAARGGLAKIRSIETLRQKGRAFAGEGREALVLRELARPNRTRFEFTLQGVTGVYVSDGTRGWQVSPFDSDMGVKPLPETTVKEAMEQADIEGPLVDWKRKGHTVELAGREVVDGSEAYKLKLTLKSGDVRYDYIDLKTHRQVRTDSTRQIHGQPVRIETTYHDHKKTGGVLFPRVIVVVAAGRAQPLRVVVDEIQVNPALSSARFELPNVPPHE